MWIFLSFIIAGFKALFGIYQTIRIMCTLSLLVILKVYINCWKFVRSLVHTFDKTGIYYWRRKLRYANSYKEWFECAEQVDAVEQNHEWKESDDNLLNNSKLVLTTTQLAAYRESDDYKKIIFELPGMVKRNHLGIDDHEVHDRCLTGTKKSIENFRSELINCFDYINQLDEKVFSTQEKVNFFQKMSRNLGQTALCLSGGGSLSMYHMGVIRALIESGNYQHIRVISGASGGSIATAMCAIKTEEELLRDVLVDTVSTDFKGTGEMERLNIRWFPPLWKQAINFLKTGFLVDNKEFMRTCQFYYENITFEEAYQMTRKHVCISVSRKASGGAGSGGPTKLLLNHISTPHVLIRSAVATSCALPGIMRANDLLCKNLDGEIVPFHVDGEGVQFIDGSVQADVPFRRMSALFSVSNFIVSQVNIHVIPFIGHKIPGALPTGSVLLKNMLSALDLDLRHRSVILSEMGIMPKFYGHDISSVFKQVYHGNVTIVPQMKVEESLGVKAIMHPSTEDMRQYIRGGRKASWPHLRRVKHLLCLEASLWTILENLVVNNKTPDSTSTTTKTMSATQGKSSNLSTIRPRPAFHTEQSVSNLVMYSAPVVDSCNSLKKPNKKYSAGAMRRSSPRLQALRNQTNSDYSSSDDTFNNYDVDVDVEDDECCDLRVGGDVYDETAITYMLQRIESLEKENLKLRRRAHVIDEDGDDFSDNDDVTTSPPAARNRRLSACLEPL